MAPGKAVLVGIRPSDFREAMTGWLRGEGYVPHVADSPSAAVEWVRMAPEAVSFVDAGLGTFDGEEVWRVVRRVLDVGLRGLRPRLVLMAENRTKDLWFEALDVGVGSVLPIPTERPVVLEALRRLSA